MDTLLDSGDSCPDPALVLHRVGKSYGGRRVLTDIDLKLDRGEFVGVVGINGAGKTTLIKAILDLCAIDVGLIKIFGVNHTHPRARARICYLPERFAVSPALTGSDYLRYVLALHQRSFDRQAVEEAFSTFDMAPSNLGLPVSTYSKGMMQKLGLIATLLAEKDLYILDEPMSGLDPKARNSLKCHLEQLRRQGKSLLLSTHMLADVANICDRMVLLHDSVFCFVGTPDEFARRYDEADLDRSFLKCIESQPR